MPVNEINSIITKCKEGNQHAFAILCEHSCSYTFRLSYRMLMQVSYNEFNEKEAGLLENHLKECESCRAELKNNELMNAFSKLLSESIPSDKYQQQFIQNVLKKIIPLIPCKALLVNQTEAYRNLI